MNRSDPVETSPSPEDLVPEAAAEQPGGVAGALRSIPRWTLTLLVVIATLGSAGSIVRVPYHSIGPGPAPDVLTLVKVTGTETYPSKGKLLLLTASVSSEPLTVWDSLYVWIDRNYSAISRDAVVTPGQTDDVQDAENFSDMEQSKLSAELAAFGFLGENAVRAPGARVLSVIRSSPADGELETGDLIVEVEGTEVVDPAGVTAAVRSRRPGQRVSIVVLRDGARRSVTLRTVPSSRDPSLPSIGVFLGEAYRLPADVEVDTLRIGGPSGGLVMALALVDVLTEEDLTAGHVVAVTGTIAAREDGDAEVGVIGAIPEKVRSARANGATVLLVPAAEALEARRLAPREMTVVGVRTLSDAVEALRRLEPRAG